MHDINRPEGEEGVEGGDDEAVISDTPFNEGDLLAGIDRLNRQDDDARVSTFRKENKNDTIKKRKKETERLYTVGSFNELKAEYVRMIFVKDYSLNPNDGQFSREFFSRLDIDKYKLTFDGTTVAYIEKDGTYKLSRDRSYLENSHNFLELYDKAREEHRVKAISTVEEETGGETSKTNAEEIFEDAKEELHQETVTVG